MNTGEILTINHILSIKNESNCKQNGNDIQSDSDQADFLKIEKKKSKFENLDFFSKRKIEIDYRISLKEHFDGIF